MTRHDWHKLVLLLNELRTAKIGADYVAKMLAIRQWVDDYVARQAQDFV